jgi:NADH-quinone oxidoreductase subunit M
MILTILLALPAAVGLVAAFLPRAIASKLAALGALGALGIAVALIVDYQAGDGMQHVTDKLWIAELGIHYKVGLDGLNLFLIALTTLGFAASVIACNFRDWGERGSLMFFYLLAAESFVLGAFLAQDLALFVIFFDLMLIPFYFIGVTWGLGENRQRMVLKMVVYTFVGSLLMLAAVIATGVLATGDGQSISFAYSDLRERTLGTGTQEWIFLLISFAFLVKMPAFPFHGWMPDGYRVLPIEVLAVFSAVLSKVAAYGFLRIALPIYPDAAAHFQDLLLILALCSILYGSVMAFTQDNIRLVAGYSSVAQLGFITLGVFALNDRGAQGAVLQMVNHGLVVIPLMLIIGVLARRSGGSESLRAMGGIAFRAPVLATLFLIVALATLAMPGSSNFIGEFLILLGVFQSKLAIACIAFTGVALAAVYALRLFIGAMHNRVGPQVESREISLRDGLVLVPLVAIIVAFAVYPQLALHRSEQSVVATVQPVAEVAK